MLSPLELHSLHISLMSRLQSAVLLLVRISFGYQFMLTGYGKLTHIDATTQNFIEWGIPMPQLNVYMAGTTECVGGALLLLGLASRYITIPLIFTMLTAYATAHRQVIIHLFTTSGLTDPTDSPLIERIRNFFDQAPFPFLLAALVVLVFGPGLFSLDAILKSWFKNCCGSEELAGGGFPVDSAQKLRRVAKFLKK